MISFSAGNKALSKLLHDLGVIFERNQIQKKKNHPTAMNKRTKTFYIGFWQLVDGMVINLYDESETLKRCVHPLERLAGFQHCDPTDPYP